MVGEGVGDQRLSGDAVTAPAGAELDHRGAGQCVDFIPVRRGGGVVALHPPSCSKC